MPLRAPRGASAARKMLGGAGGGRHFSFSFEIYSLTDNLQAGVLFREHVFLARLPVTIVSCGSLMKMKTEKQELFACWGGLQVRGHKRGFYLQWPPSARSKRHRRAPGFVVFNSCADSSSALDPCAAFRAAETRLLPKLRAPHAVIGMLISFVFVILKRAFVSHDHGVCLKPN